MELFSAENLASLGVLIFLQAVLGFDNLLYISIESQRAPAESQASVRKYGILIAVALRVVLLFVMISLLEKFQAPLFGLHWVGIVEGDFTFSTVVFLLGGVFLMYTAIKEISHLLAIEHLEEQADKDSKPAAQVIAMIVLMNLIFSFDSILSALAITKVFVVLATAIVISGVLMLVLADTVAAFIERNRKYEVLGLFILLIVGVVLLGEGGHEAHLTLFGYKVEAMAKSTFYFSIGVLVIVDVIQSKYQNKLAARRAAATTVGGGGMSMMNRQIKFSVAALISCLFLLVGGGATASGGKPQAPAELPAASASMPAVTKPGGQFGRQILVLEKPLPVPDYIFEEQMSDGSTKELALVDFRGRVVVLNFWATWCGVCAKELPKFDSVAPEFAQSGIDVLALSLDEEMAIAASTLQKRGHRQLRIFRDSQSILSALLGVRGVPTTFVVRPNGDAVAMVQGPADWSSPEALTWLRSLAPGMSPVAASGIGAATQSGRSSASLAD